MKSVDALPFPAQRSILAAGALATLLEEHFALGEVRCTLIKAHMSDTYRVSSQKGMHILRVYRATIRTRAEIEAELAFLAYLAESGIPVSVARPTLNGELLLEIQAIEGTRYAALFTYALGAPPEKVHRTPPIRDYGLLAARLHEAADRLPVVLARPAMDLPALLEEPLRALKPVLLLRPIVMDYLEELARFLQGELASLAKTPPHYGLCHNDLGRGNVHLDGWGRLMLFDFDLCGPGWRACDIAVFLMNESDEMREAFLAGYESLRPLRDTERDSLPLFQAARHLWILGVYAANVNEWGTLRLSDSFLNHHIAEIQTGLRPYPTPSSLNYAIL